MAEASSEPLPDFKLSRAAIRGLVAGTTAGIAVGVTEALLAWGDASHFLFTAGSKLRFTVFLAGLYASVGAALGALGGAAGAALLRYTRLGDAVAAAIRHHRQARERDPRDALAWLSLALAGVPILAVTLAVTYLAAYEFLATRRHPGLVIAVAMTAGAGALVGAAIASFIAARPVELLLRALARGPRISRALSAPPTALATAAVLLVCAGALAMWATWDLLMLLPVDTALAGVFIALLAAPAARLARPLTDRLFARRAAVRRAAVAAIPVVLVGATLLTGASSGARKTVDQYTGLGDPAMRVYQALFFLGRGGHHPVVGDAACDPLERDRPEEGIGEDCAGADAVAALIDRDPLFAELPDTVPEKPNVVLITIDTLRHDHLGAYGYDRDTSPNIDAVADHGTLFEHSWAHAPSTRYSLPAILTGRYPLNVDYDYSVQGWPGISEDNTTIAEIVQGQGYRTAAFTNHWYFSRVRSMDQGFDIYDNSNQRLHEMDGDAGPAETTGSSSRQQSDSALEFLAGHLEDDEADEPFFLWVHYYDPHYVYQKHEGFDFGDERVDLYDSEIAFTDHHIGRVFDDLRQRGVWDETAVIVASDHGEGFGERGIYLHGYDLYAPQTRVPLVMRVPGTQPRRIDMPVGHVDILPTIANLVGAEPSREMMGRSLIDLITGEHPDDEDRWVFQQLSYEGNNELRGAANHQCHVIYNISPHPSWELYRIDIDPAQERDRIGDPGPCAEGPAVLYNWHNYAQIPWDAAESLLSEEPVISDPLDVHYGAEIELLDVQLPDQPVRRRDSFEVTYTFRAGGSMSDAWDVFVHFTSDDGGYFQGDHAPARPTTWWRDGQYIEYTRTAQVPSDTPAGDYDVWLGFFQGDTRRPAYSERAQVEDDRARVGTIQVK